MAMTLLGSHVLSLILFTPLAGALLLLVIPRRHEAAIRWIANLFGVTGFVASLPLWFRYQPQGAPWQFVERAEWIPSIGASYFLGVDGLSALLVLLTTLIGAIADPVVLVVDRRSDQGVLRLPPRPADRA